MRCGESVPARCRHGFAAGLLLRSRGRRLGQRRRSRLRGRSRRACCRPGRWRRQEVQIGQPRLAQLDIAGNARHQHQRDKRAGDGKAPPARRRCNGPRRRGGRGGRGGRRASCRQHGRQGLGCRDRLGQHWRLAVVEARRRTSVSSGRGGRIHRVVLVRALDQRRRIGQRIGQRDEHRRRDGARQVRPTLRERRVATPAPARRNAVHGAAARAGRKVRQVGRGRKRRGHRRRVAAGTGVRQHNTEITPCSGVPAPSLARSKGVAGCECVPA